MILLLLVGCKKDDKQVTYSAVGTGASIEYVNSDEVWQRASLYSHANDSVPAQWSYTFTAPHDGTANFTIKQEYGARTPATGILSIDGIVVSQKTVTNYGDEVSINE